MSLTADAFKAAVRGSLDEARARRNAILALPADATANEVVDAFDGIREALDGSGGTAGLYSSVHPDEALRTASEELEQELAAFETDLGLDRELYERLAPLEASDLDGGERRRLLAHALRDYRRSGVDRDEDTRERVRALQEELVEIGQTFDRNIIQGGRELVIEEGVEALAGLPDDWITAHPPGEDGAIRLSTDAPDFQPFMLYAERADLRERFFDVYVQRAYPENEPVLAQLLAKRHELANLLGYGTWAEYVTEILMVGDPDAARGFVERVAELARPSADVVYQELLAEKRKHDPGAEVVLEWESGYLSEQIKRSRFDFDSQAVRPYFAYDAVEQGLLQLSEALYGVEIVRAGDADAWHEDVRSFEVREGGRAVARFHLDMFPREGKYKHAAMFDVRGGREGHSLPEASLVCNFPRPSESDPGLLLHSQVTTFFHEFGHLLHMLFGGGQRYHRFSGIACEWDFVEVPSQLYEEWAWDPGVLAGFARHHETGEVIPPALVERLRSAEEYGKALGVTRQMVFARLSLACYTQDPSGLDPDGLVDDLKRRMSPLAPVAGHMSCSFGHLNGYSAIYYTYMWSLVIAKDFWSAFEADPMDAELAGRYRAAVLAPGGAQDAADLVRSFLGRDYGMDAWEHWLAS
jgi:thimet oligopeptidase